jgi:hypothetical protein
VPLRTERTKLHGQARVSAHGTPNADLRNKVIIMMRSPMFNLFTEDAHGKPIWLGAVADLGTAWLRLTQLASVNAGEYFIFNLRSKQIVGSLVSMDEEVTRTCKRKFDYNGLQRCYPIKWRHYDIVRKDRDKSAIWLETATDLNTAESRIEELSSFWPGEFHIMDQQNHQIVEKIVGPLRPQPNP